MFRQPVVVMAGGKETMQGPHVRALVRGPPVAIFTSELLTTGNGRDNHAAVQAVSPGRQGGQGRVDAPMTQSILSDTCSRHRSGV
jgi:hypothetical protein